VHELGRLCKEMGLANEAVNHFTQCLSLKPNEPEYSENLTLALLDAGKIKEAIEQLNKGIQLHPHHPKLNKLLAKSNFEFDISKHLQHYQSIAIDNMPSDLFHNYVQQLIQLDEIEQAQALVSSVKKQNINANSHLALQIKLLEKQHKFEQIIDILSKKVKQND
jgi:tetratricopeptide (TPR) repeat protein